MATLSTPPQKKTNPLTNSDFEFLQENHYRQELHRSMLEQSLVTIRQYPDAERKHVVGAFYAALNYAFPEKSAKV